MGVSIVNEPIASSSPEPLAFVGRVLIIHVCQVNARP